MTPLKWTEISTVIAQNICENEHHFSKSVRLSKQHFLFQGFVYTAKLHKDNLK